MQDDEFKPCPFCKESIRVKAVKCRYCGEWLDQPASPHPTQPTIQQANVDPVPPVTNPISRPAPTPAETVQTVIARTEAPRPSQDDFILGEKVFRDLAEQHNIYPGRDTWEYEYLEQRKPAENPPQQFLDELWDASDKAGRKTKTPEDDMEIGDTVFRQLTEKLKRYPLEEEWVEAFQVRKGSNISVPPLTLRKIWLAADISGRKTLAEHEKDKKAADKMGGLKSLNGILLALYVLGIIGILMNGGALSPKNIGSNFMVMLMALCPLSGFLAASKPDNKARRTFAKFANGLMAGLMILTIIVLICFMVVSFFQKNEKSPGSVLTAIIFMLLFVGLPAFLNLKAFWKEKPNQKTAPDKQEVKQAEPNEAQIILPAVEIPPPPPAANEAPNTEKSETATKVNYFVRHWRGDLSLGVSYWANGFLATFLILFAANMMVALRGQISLKVIALLSLMLYAMTIMVSVWQCVGVWRSSSKHVSRGGSSGWATAAKVAVVIGVLNWINLIFNNFLPQSAEMVRILAGDNSIPSYKIQILPGGTEVEFRGGLRAGCAKDLENILTAVPQAKVLHIESIGGRIIEAEAMMKMVREHNLITYTSERCLSAATLVLMSGKERVIEEGAKVGFHAGTFPGMTSDQLQEMNGTVRSTMQSAGISESFISRVLATPADQMWYPTYEEMKDAGVITSKTIGERFASTLGMPDVDWQAAIKNISTMPCYRVIKQVEPETFAFMMTNFVAALQSGKSEAEALGPIQDSAARLMAKYLPVASDEAILALRDQWIAVLGKYKDTKSQFCVAFLMQAKINYKRAFPDWNMTNSLLVMEKVISSGATGAVAQIDKKAAEDDMAIALKPVADRYGDDVKLLYSTTNWPANSQRVCDMLLMLYQQEAALPDNRCANLLRNNLSE